MVAHVSSGDVSGSIVCGVVVRTRVMTPPPLPHTRSHLAAGCWKPGTCTLELGCKNVSWRHSTSGLCSDISCIR